MRKRALTLRRIGLHAGVVAAMLTPSAWAADPAGATRQFLQAYQPLASAGVPKPAQLPALQKHLHPELRQALETVSTQQAASTCEGPPAIQGDLITSLFEGPNQSQVLPCRIRTGVASCPVRFTYRGTPEGVRWTDVVELRLHADRWVVSDVVQGAPWSGKSRLSIRLAEASRVLSACRLAHRRNLSP